MKTFIIILCGLISFTSISQTTVSGIISNNTIWTLNNSPYIITGNTLIMSGFELEVQISSTFPTPSKINFITLKDVSRNYPQRKDLFCQFK